VKSYSKITFSVLSIGVVWISGFACGQSEDIGWANREMPDSVTARAAATDSLVQQQATQAAADAVAEEYRQLSASLQQVLMQALSEPDLESGWNAIVAEADAAILSRSAFHRGLQARRQDIERLMQQPDTLSAERQAELMRNYRNIQLEMARVRNEEFRKPEFADRFIRFQRALFARMKELAPERSADIDRLLEIEEQTFVPLDTTTPVPGMQPVR
jgi:hypothetical protein